MPVDMECLQDLSLLRGLNSVELEELAAHLDEAHMRAGEEIIREDDPPGHPLFFLLKGSVDVIKRGVDGRGHVISNLSAPSVFGEVEALVHRRAIAGIVASTDIKVARLRRGVFDEMCKAQRSCALKVIRNLAKVLSYRLAATDEKLAAQFDLAGPSNDTKLMELRQVIYSGWRES
jgi:CRP-like cAMP-binding protein